MKRKRDSDGSAEAPTAQPSHPAENGPSGIQGAYIGLAKQTPSEGKRDTRSEHRRDGQGGEEAAKVPPLPAARRANIGFTARVYVCMYGLRYVVYVVAGITYMPRKQAVSCVKKKEKKTAPDTHVQLQMPRIRQRKIER
ncbi:hypothetical protein MRX96_012907 [Rhipicephalus microplus]